MPIGLSKRAKAKKPKKAKPAKKPPKAKTNVQTAALHDLLDDMIDRGAFQADQQSRQLLEDHGLWPTDERIKQLSDKREFPP